MSSQTPIFDGLVAEFGENNKNYIDLVGGIKPTFVEPKGATNTPEPLGQHANDETQRIDPIVTFSGVSASGLGLMQPEVIDAIVQRPRIVDATAVQAEPEGGSEKKSGVYPRREKDNDTTAQTETSASPDDSA